MLDLPSQASPKPFRVLSLSLAEPARELTEGMRIYKNPAVSGRMPLMCVLRDKIVRAMYGSDDPFVRLGALALPMNLPSRLRNSFRDDHIRTLASILRAGHSAINDHAIARLIIEAAESLDRSAAPSSPALEGLSTIERDQIVEQLHRLRRWLPRNRAGRWLPRKRQLLTIIAR